MHHFQLLEPINILEASKISKKYGKKATLLAGGTDVLVNIKQKKIQPDFLINLKKINSLYKISFDQEKGLRIGSLVTLAEIEANPIIKQNYSILFEAAHSVAAQQIRNRATIGGNVCNAAPSADTVPALIALDAKVKLFSLESEKVILLEDFFLGPGETILRSGELLTEFILPILNPNSKTVFVKHSFRRALDLAMVSVAIRLDLDLASENVKEARIVMGAVAPTTIRARNAEQMLIKKNLKKISAEILKEVAKQASQESKPISDIRSSAYYRKEMLYQIIFRELKNFKKMI